MSDEAKNIAAALFGGTRDTEPTEQKEEQATNPGELDADRAELARRYSLSTEDVQRVRGESWAERCADAERLAQLSESQSIRDRARRHLQAMQGENPNKGELAALTGHAERKAQATTRLLGVGSEEPADDEEGPPDFDFGAREPAPASDPKAEHDALVVEYLSTLPPAGGGGEW